MANTLEGWDLVDQTLGDAKGIAFDTCHKIYVLMDDEQVAQMREYDYDPLITSDQMNADEMYRTLVDWYEQSCGLRFIEAVYTNNEDPNLGFETLIPQGYAEDCEDCGEVGCKGVCNDLWDEDEDDDEDEEDETDD